MTAVNYSHLDNVVIVSEGLTWQVLMVDMLGRGESRSMGHNKGIEGIIREVSRYNPRSIQVFY